MNFFSGREGGEEKGLGLDNGTKEVISCLDDTAALTLVNKNHAFVKEGGAKVFPPDGYIRNKKNLPEEDFSRKVVVTCYVPPTDMIHLYVTIGHLSRYPYWQDTDSYSARLLHK